MSTFSHLDQGFNPSRVGAHHARGVRSTLKQGMRGNDVRALQRRLGVKADGIFGSRTRSALTEYQRRHGLKADGIAGRRTFSQMFGPQFGSAGGHAGASRFAGSGQSLGATRTVLKQGMRGNDVRALQRRLGVRADGVFGPKTCSALTQYQRRHGLRADGIAGKQTFSQMFGPQFGSARGGGLAANQSSFRSRTRSVLKQGMRGNDVRELQRRLGVKADGVFGSRTRSALTRYQRQHGLKADGIAGRQTFSQMFGSQLGSAGAQGTGGPAATGQSLGATRTVLKQGMRGNDVRTLQRHLGVKVDGIFGSRTQSALTKYQRQHGLKADGIAGRQTLGKLSGRRSSGGGTTKARASGSRISQTIKKTEPKSPFPKWDYLKRLKQARHSTDSGRMPQTMQLPTSYFKREGHFKSAGAKLQKTRSLNVETQSLDALRALLVERDVRPFDRRDALFTPDPNKKYVFGLDAKGLKGMGNFVTEMERCSGGLSPLQKPGERQDAITRGPFVFFGDPDSNAVRWTHRETIPEGVSRINNNWVERRGKTIKVLPSYPEDPSRINSLLWATTPFSMWNMSRKPDPTRVDRFRKANVKLNQYMRTAIQRGDSLRKAEQYKGRQAVLDLKREVWDASNKIWQQLRTPISLSP